MYPPPTEVPAPQRHGCRNAVGAVVIALIALVVLVIIGALVAGDDDDTDTTAATNEATEGPVSNSGNDDNPPADDVTVTTCAADPTVGWISATGTIVNHSSEASTYLGTVEFVADGVRYGESPFSSSAVAPGQTVEFTAPGAVDARPNTECRVTQVERFAS